MKREVVSGGYQSQTRSVSPDPLSPRNFLAKSSAIHPQGRGITNHRRVADSGVQSNILWGPARLVVSLC